MAFSPMESRTYAEQWEPSFIFYPPFLLRKILEMSLLHYHSIDLLKHSIYMRVVLQHTGTVTQKPYMKVED